MMQVDRKKRTLFFFKYHCFLKGVKRPKENSNLVDGNSNTKTSRSNRNDVRIDPDYNSSK